MKGQNSFSAAGLWLRRDDRPYSGEVVDYDCAFLCTEDAKWINAQRIEVSGGMNL